MSTVQSPIIMSDIFPRRSIQYRVISFHADLNSTISIIMSDIFPRRSIQYNLHHYEYIFPRRSIQYHHYEWYLSTQICTVQSPSLWAISFHADLYSTISIILSDIFPCRYTVQSPSLWVISFHADIYSTISIIMSRYILQSPSLWVISFHADLYSTISIIMSDIFPRIMSDIFPRRYIQYNLHHSEWYLSTQIYTVQSQWKQDFLTRNTHSVRYVTDSLSYLGPKVWDLIPNEIKDAKTLNTFKSKIKK